MSDYSDLLFEIGTEELPPAALQSLSEALTRSFIGGLNKSGLHHGEVLSFATPRRLAVLVKDCASRQPDREVERRGPAVAAAFGPDGKATKAAQGFARSCGTSPDNLQRIQTDKGEWLVFKVRETGKPAKDLLPTIAEHALNGLPIPRRMRWGDSDAQFVRPVHWILFLLGEEIVTCTLMEAQADRFTYGHRFHHPDSIEIKRPQDYAANLEGIGRVIASFPDRQEKIRHQVETTAASLGGRAEMDPALLGEVTALVEWPVPIAASFEERFLDVPAEALILTMKKNQKYFPLFDANGRLMNHFITIANIDSPRPEIIQEGNERVIRPRLADAMFFWQQDGKKRLEDFVPALKNVVFQQKLGSLYEKTERVAALAVYIAERINGDPDLARRAALLSRCDLLTQVVNEFPEMQGIMGRYQAARDGEPAELAQALDEFYMPRFSGDALPSSKTGIALSLAERLDTLMGIFGIGQKPSGDKDPFGLRRAALGALRILREHSLRIDILDLLETAKQLLGDCNKDPDLVASVYGFLLERLRGLYGDDGFGPDLYEAVSAVKPKQLVDFDKRIKAVAKFRDLPEAESLSAANKRISNILRRADLPVQTQVNISLFRQPEEQELHKQIAQMATDIQPLYEAGDYASTLKTLAGLRNIVDHFFDEVLVMAEDPALRNNRLALLQSLSELFLKVADISRLQPNA